jgi:hypothetical protein
MFQGEDSVFCTGSRLSIDRKIDDVDDDAPTVVSFPAVKEEGCVGECAGP